MQTNFNPGEYAENALLSLIINSKRIELLSKAYDKIPSHTFFSSKDAGIIYGVLIDQVFTKGLAIDNSAIAANLHTTREKMKLDSIIAEHCDMSNFNFYIDEISRNGKNKELDALLTEINLNSKLEGLDDPDQRIDQLKNGLLRIESAGKASFTSAKEILINVLDDINKGGEETNLSTGIDSLDLITDKLQKKMVVLGARPSLGKTAQVLNIVKVNCIENGIRTAVHSLEMDSKTLIKRLLASVSGIPYLRLIHGDLHSDELCNLEMAVEKIDNAPLHIDDSAGLYAGQIASRLKSLKLKYKDLNLVCVDYLQLLKTKSTNGDNQASAIGESMNILFNTRKSLDVAMIIVSQLSRECEKRSDKRPILSDLRSSGDIEQAADQVWFLYSDAYYDKDRKNDPLWDMEIIVAKNRDGATGVANLRMDRPVQRLYDIQ